MKRDIIDLTGETSVQPAKKPKYEKPKVPIEAFARVQFVNKGKRLPSWETVITGGQLNTPTPIVGCGGFKLANNTGFIMAYSVNVGVFRSKTLGDTAYSSKCPEGVFLKSPTVTHFCTGLEFEADSMESIYADDPGCEDKFGFEDEIYAFFEDRMDFDTELLHWTNYSLYIWRRFYFMFRNRETRGIAGREDSLLQLGAKSQFYDPTLTPWERQLQNLPRALVVRIFEFWYDGGISMVYFGDLAWNAKFIDEPKITASNFSAIIEQQKKLDEFADYAARHFAPIHFLTSDNHHWHEIHGGNYHSASGNRYRRKDLDHWGQFKERCSKFVGCSCCSTPF